MYLEKLQYEFEKAYYIYIDIYLFLDSINLLKAAEFKELGIPDGFGFAFIFGRGSQWFSWLHMKDLLRIYLEVAVNENLSGPVNACAPNPVRFQDFIKTLTQFKKSIAIPFPAWILKLFLQETADVILFSQRMIPGKMLKANYEFTFPKLEDALREIFADTK